MSRSEVNRLRRSLGHKMHKARMTIPASAPSRKAMPMQRRMGGKSFLPQYWEPRTTIPSPNALARNCTTKKIWLMMAAPDRADWL